MADVFAPPIFTALTAGRLRSVALYTSRPTLLPGSTPAAAAIVLAAPESSVGLPAGYVVGLARAATGFIAGRAAVLYPFSATASCASGGP